VLKAVERLSIGCVVFVAAIGSFSCGYGDSSVARALECSGLAASPQVPIAQPSIEWSSFLEQASRIKTASCWQ